MAKLLLRSLVVLCLSLIGIRMAVIAAITPTPPPPSSLVETNRMVEVVEVAEGEKRFLHTSWVRRRGGILQVHLEGTPEQIGQAHAQLLRQEMLRNEEALWSVFHTFVPVGLLRVLIMDTARLRFSSLEKSIGYARRAEIAASSRGFRPDPFDDYLPSYHRFLMLNALYDISLSFEHSPLIGCSSVVVPDAPGGTLLGRTFDFEAHEIFDREKAVLVFAENGKIPVLSVAWPGLSGVVTGMNGSGVAAVVHGARAGSPSRSGQPVLITIREALAHATTANQAAAWIAARAPMISHLVLVADAEGNSIVVERVPGQPASLRPSKDRVALTNHLEGPHAQDPSNLRIRETTSTLDRRERLDVLLSSNPEPKDEMGVLGILRDRRAPDGSDLPRGDRRAIDADIATHGVVMNLRERVVWVSKGPHLAGPFLRFDLGAWLKDPAREFLRDEFSALGDE